MAHSKNQHNSGRVSPTGIVEKEKLSFCESFGITLGSACLISFIGVCIYNFIYSIIAIINFTKGDVENVCPNSELWWFALFLGVIWPILLSNSLKSNMEKKDNDNVSMGFCVAIIYLILLTTFSVWAWDQLYGLSGFANDDCAKVHWQFKNTTEGANNDGHALYTAVEWWMYIYISVVTIILLAIIGFGGIMVVESKRHPETTNQTVYRSNETDVQSQMRLQKVLTGETV